jgi:uncharacterized Zn finger protein
VRGGVKLHSAEPPGTGSWAAARIVRLLESAAEGARLKEGLEYAKLGQTLRMNYDPGSITASVQGRVDRAYRTSLALTTFNESKWESVVQAMSDQAVYAAKLLAGELPASIEDLFAPMQLRLFPAEPADMTPACTCGDEQKWCKHACCIGYLLAERLATDPFLMILLRGLPGEDLLEKIRQRRVVAGAVGGTVPVYAARVPGVSDMPSRPLDQCIENFWDGGSELGQIDLQLERPQVNHPLLRRLGPSPFQDGAARAGQPATPRFPLVGLLATCFELISEATLRDAATDTGSAPPPAESQAAETEPADTSDNPDESASA